MFYAHMIRNMIVLFYQDYKKYDYMIIVVLILQDCTITFKNYPVGNWLIHLNKSNTIISNRDKEIEIERQDWKIHWI